MLVVVRCVALFALMGCCLSAAAQTPNANELFKQKKTQIRYLVEQIAALQVYLGKLKDGYEIVDKGLTTIGNIKDGKFSMDKQYIHSLGEVSPIVANSPLLDQIANYNRANLSALGGLDDEVHASDDFTSEEKEYIASLRTTVAGLCAAWLDEVVFLTSVGKSEMTDDERLSYLERIHGDFKRTFSFTGELVQSTRFIGVQRARERQAINVLRQLHGVMP